jgi:hypothetical protein
VSAQSFADTVLGSTRPSVIALTIAVALLLVIACVNIGNLSLVRLLGRIREIAVRRAIGARSIDVVRLFAVENALLGLLGGALGFLTAVAALQLVRAAAPPQLPRIDALGSLGPPLAAAVGITLFALLVFGVLPSLVASRIQSYAVLRSDSRTGAESRSSRRARQWLVAVQIALAIVVLNGAGLLVRTLARLESVDTGYRAEYLSLLAFSGTAQRDPSWRRGWWGGEGAHPSVRGHPRRRVGDAAFERAVHRAVALHPEAGACRPAGERVGAKPRSFHSSSWARTTSERCRFRFAEAEASQAPTGRAPKRSWS